MTFIDKLNQAAAEICPADNVPWLVGTKNRDVIALRGSCKRWSCRVCGARNGKQWLARILDGMRKLQYPRWYFLTITAHKNWRGMAASLKNIRQGWKKLYNRMRRRYGVSDYVKVWEKHADGTLHLHLLIARKIGKKWLRQNCVECGMGYMVDSTPSKNAGQVAGYVAKYLLKSYESICEPMPRGLRRIECSRTFPALPDLSNSDDYVWTVCANREYQRRVLARYRDAGMRVVDKATTSPRS